MQSNAQKKFQRTRTQARTTASNRQSLMRTRFSLALICIAGLLGIYFFTSGSACKRWLSLAMPILNTVPEQSPQKNEDQPQSQYSNASNVNDDIRIEVLNAQKPTTLNPNSSEPTILIYHTHTTEAYTQTAANAYKETGKWRTNENDKNIVAVGEKLATVLSEQYGFSVIHDTTNHEPPKLQSSYDRSVKTMEKYKKQYPSLTMFIDVHRDAYTPKGENDDYVVIDGKRMARLMFVVGTGKGATGTGYSKMPDFESNYALASAITDRLSQFNPRLVRDIRVKTGRYNQHISNQCLLVEVGHNANTLEEALTSIDYLAQAIAESVNGKSDQAASTSTLWVPK